MNVFGVFPWLFCAITMEILWGINISITMGLWIFLFVLTKLGSAAEWMVHGGNQNDKS